MKKVSSLIVLASLLTVATLQSQANLLNAKVPQETGIRNEDQLLADNTSPIPYGYVDDRDVLWSKTVWEIIDLDERINFPYYYPAVNNGLLSSDRRSLFRILMDGIEAGTSPKFILPPISMKN